MIMRYLQKTIEDRFVFMREEQMVMRWVQMSKIRQQMNVRLWYKRREGFYGVEIFNDQDAL